MACRAVALISAINAHEITVSEFEETVFSLTTETAQLAVSMLTAAWTHNEKHENPSRLEAWERCRRSQQGKSSLN
jgi:hypothetical protein